MKFKPLILLLLPLLYSCSTTRVLSPGQTRLVSNEVVFTSEESLPPSKITPYLRQNPGSPILNSINPFLYVYNWAGRSDSSFSSFLRKIGKAPMVFDSTLVSSSVDNISSHLTYLGYYGSDVSAKVVNSGKKTRVSYFISLSGQKKIDRINYRIPDDFREEFDAYLPASLLKEGAMLSEALLQSECASALEYFRNRGYYVLDQSAFSFVADTLSQPGSTILEYVVENPGQVHRLGRISLSYPSSLKIRESFLKDLNLLKSGMIYREKDVSNSYNRLTSMRMFNSVGIELTPAGPSTVDCEIKLRNSDLKGFKADLQASTNSSGLLGISPQLAFYHKNLFHGGEWLNVSFIGNFQFRPSDHVHSNELGFSSSLSLPRFLGVSNSKLSGPNIPRTEFGLSYNYQNRPEYVRQIASANFGYKGVFSRNLYYQLNPVRISLVKLADIDPVFRENLSGNPYIFYSYQDHLDAGLEAVLYHSSSQDIVPKTSYRSNRISLSTSGNLAGLLASSQEILGLPFSQYLKLQLESVRVIRFGNSDKNAIAGRIVAGAGYAYGNSTAMPFESQFYCGGAGSMRGWQARSLGPGGSPVSDLFTIPSQTGDFKLEADLEYRFNLFWKMEGAIFAEAGNVWNLREMDDFYRYIALDWGPGLRLNLDFILIRLDMGFKLHDPSLAPGARWLGPSSWLRRGGSAIHFGVGYPF